MSFIKRVRGFYYLVEKVKIGERYTHRYLRPATESEITAYHELKHRKNNTAIMTCDYPDCDTPIKTSREHKWKLNTIDPLKGKIEFVYCSTKCQQEHYRALKGKGDDK